MATLTIDQRLGRSRADDAGHRAGTLRVARAQAVW
jgi:hypothetical protein